MNVSSSILRRYIKKLLPILLVKFQILIRAKASNSILGTMPTIKFYKLCSINCFKSQKTKHYNLIKKSNN